MVAREGFEVAFYLGSPQESGVLKGQGGARPMEIHFVSESVIDGTTLPAWSSFHNNFDRFTVTVSGMVKAEYSETYFFSCGEACI